MADDDAIGADPLAHGGEQDALQVGAMDRQLRRRMAGPAADGFVVDELAEAVEERPSRVTTATRSSSARTPSDASAALACGRTLMPTPSGRISAAAS